MFAPGCGMLRLNVVMVREQYWVLKPSLSISFRSADATQMLRKCQMLLMKCQMLLGKVRCYLGNVY